MQLFASLGVQRVVVRALLGCPAGSLLVLVSTLGACSLGPSHEAPATPCAAVPASPTPARPAPLGEDAVYMANSGSLHVFVSVSGYPTVGHYVRGLPASFRLDDDASAPTALTVLAPLRFEAVTLFPAYYLRRQVVHARPEVTLAAGTALHRVARIGGGQCQGYLGFPLVTSRKPARWPAHWKHLGGPKTYCRFETT